MLIRNFKSQYFREIDCLSWERMMQNRNLKLNTLRKELSVPDSSVLIVLLLGPELLLPLKVLFKHLVFDVFLIFLVFFLISNALNLVLLVFLLLTALRSWITRFFCSSLRHAGSVEFRGILFFEHFYLFPDLFYRLLYRLIAHSANLAVEAL